MHDDGGDDIGVKESPDDTEKSEDEEDEYEVIKGMQEQEEDYEPSKNVWTVHVFFAHNTIIAAHMGRRRLPSWWLLLDNCLTSHIFINFHLVNNIRIATEPIRVHLIGTVRSTNHESDLTNTGTV